MVLQITRFLSVVAFLVSAVHSWGYALLGPVNETFQVGNIAYNLPGDIGAPKNLGEEYRWSRPMLYYAANQNFLDYFGSNGLNAVDGAFTIVNALTNVSSYSSNLTEFPLEAMRENYLAQALLLYDIKSQTLEFIVEQMGLAEPERYVWSLHNRYLTPGGQCPVDMNYDVIKRNFDPIFSTTDQLQSSSYVNGTLYSYLIFENCNGPDPLADADEFPVDPTAQTFTAVASGFSTFGGFYTGLTRDDVGGLRYLLRANNYNFESAGADTVTYITNNSVQLLFTSNLTQLINASLVNDAAALVALFPNLQVLNTIPFFTNVITTNFFPVFINHPSDPAGTVRLVFNTTITTNIETRYSHQFGNVYLTPNIQLGGNLSVPLGGHVLGSNLVQVLTTNIGLSACPPGQPYTGFPCTNVSITTFWTNGIFGDYYILPSNLCSVALISTQLIRSVSFTNTVVATNAPGTTNQFIDEFSQSTISSFNQYVYQVRPVVCPQDLVGLRQGIERIRFERRDYDSLIGRFFYPVTNTYELVMLTNNTLVRQSVQRVITEPDFLIDAQDTSPGPGQVAGPAAWGRDIFYDQGSINPGLAGPGSIEPGATMIFNKVGPIYYNFAPNFLDEAGQSLWFIWGSFDGTTNAPIVYPNGTDLRSIENQVLIQISPAGPALPNAMLGINYNTLFTGFSVTGGAAPYQWSIPFGSAGLPSGLSLNTATGQISGVPTTLGTYDFTIRMTDAAARYVDRNYSIEVTP